MNQRCKACGKQFDNAEKSDDCPPCIAAKVLRDFRVQEIRSWIILSIMTIFAAAAAIYGLHHLWK